MKEKGNFGRIPYEMEYVGQGVSVEFERTTSEGGIRLKSDITDGNGNYMGHIEVNETLKKAYVDVQNIDRIKRSTLVNLFNKIAESVAYSLREEVAAEAEPAQEEGSSVSDSE